MQKILIVEDDEMIQEELAQLLRAKGYQATALLDYDKILSYVQREMPDLILLDINLPNQDGFTLCTAIKSIQNIPIIFITGRDSSIDELHAFCLGGDDYVTKPYNVPVLLARIQAVMNRNLQPTEYVEYQKARLYPMKAILSHEGKEVELTKTELKILYLLMTSKGTIVSRDDLMDFLWDNHIHIDDNSLSVQISYVRGKCRQVDLGDFIKTKRGLGYSI